MFWSRVRFTYWGGEGNRSGWHLRQKTWEAVCHFAIQGVKILLLAEGRASDLLHVALAGHLFSDRHQRRLLQWGRVIILLRKRLQTEPRPFILGAESCQTSPASPLLSVHWICSHV